MVIGPMPVHDEVSQIPYTGCGTQITYDLVDGFVDDAKPITCFACLSVRGDGWLLRKQRKNDAFMFLYGGRVP